MKRGISPEKYMAEVIESQEAAISHEGYPKRKLRFGLSGGINISLIPCKKVHSWKLKCSIIFRLLANSMHLATSTCRKWATLAQKGPGCAFVELEKN